MTDPGLPLLIALLDSPSLRAFSKLELPPGADMVLVERMKATRELFKARERGATDAELLRLGDRLLDLMRAVSGSRTSM